MNREEPPSISMLKRTFIENRSIEARIQYLFEAIVDLDAQFRTHTHADENKTPQLLTLKYQDGSKACQGLEIRGTAEQIAELLAILKRGKGI